MESADNYLAVRFASDGSAVIADDFLAHLRIDAATQLRNHDGNATKAAAVLTLALLDIAGDGMLLAGMLARVAFDLADWSGPDDPIADDVRLEVYDVLLDHPVADQAWAVLTARLVNRYKAQELAWMVSRAVTQRVLASTAATAESDGGWLADHAQAACRRAIRLLAVLAMLVALVGWVFNLGDTARQWCIATAWALTVVAAGENGITVGLWFQNRRRR